MGETHFESLEPRRLLADTASVLSYWTPAPDIRAMQYAAVAPPANVGGVATSAATTASLKLAWSAPTDADAPNLASYHIRAIPGVEGTSAAITKSFDIPAPATSATLSGLLNFTLYSIEITAVDRGGRRSMPVHLTAWTTAPAGQKRYLYAIDLPKDKTGFTNLTPQVEVFDINNNNEWVKNIPLPTGIYGTRGVAACAATGKLYITFYDTPVDTYQTGGLVCVDLNTSKVLWVRHYDKSIVPSPDRFDITPDGSKIYMPVGENGPDNFWEVLDGATGDPLGRITFVTAPHNTIVSLDGSRVFMEGQEKGTQPAEFDHRIGVADTTTDTLVKTIGPFRDVVRPYTINGAGTLVYATVNNFVGFQVADAITGKILYTVAPPNYTQPTTTGQDAYSHGIAMTPDEKYLYVADELKIGFHVWDISQTPAQAPNYLGFVKTRARGKNLAGQSDPKASNDADGVPAWIVSSYDGKYMYAESGEVIDAATMKVVGQLEAGSSAPYTHSRFMLEVDFDAAGKLLRVTDQFGIGRVLS